jgi:hypothetical protein
MYETYLVDVQYNNIIYSTNMLIIVISNIIDLVNHDNHFLFFIFFHIEILVKFNTQFAKLVKFTLLKKFPIYL